MSLPKKKGKIEVKNDKVFINGKELVKFEYEPIKNIRHSIRNGLDYQKKESGNMIIDTWTITIINQSGIEAETKIEKFFEEGEAKLRYELIKNTPKSIILLSKVIDGKVNSILGDDQ